MADEKTPKPKIELGDKSESAAGAGAAPDASKKAPDDGSYTVGEAVRDGAGRLFSWVRRTFPGHEHAFWGGVIGFLAAVLFLVLGLWRALVIVILVIIGVAAGQALDGDSKIMDLMRHLFSRN